MITDPILVRLGGSLYALLLIFASFPIAFVSGALATDLTDIRTANMLWADLSDRLLAAAMFFGARDLRRPHPLVATRRQNAATAAR